MSHNSDDNQPHDQSTVGEESECSPPNGENWPVQVDDLQKIEPGDGIAVRATADFGDSILAGTVTWQISEDPHEVAIDTLEEAEEFGARPSQSRVEILSIDADVWWVKSDGEFTDRSDILQDRPKMQPYLGEPPQEPPDCALSYRNDGRIGLVIPGPVSNGRRVKSYAPDDCGTVTDILSGKLVDPEHLLRDDIAIE